ncbi:MAG: hypothetical protein WCW25_04250 [Patescibacteria group bacterium]|jgi:hypothetical protein
MEKFEEGKVVKERATDMELALFLIKHISNPCEDEHGHNIRDFYIREAERALGEFSDSEARKLLEDAIKIFRIAGSPL